MVLIRETTEGITFALRVLPRSSRCELAGIQGDAVKLKITAPPVEGLANEECIRFLSKTLQVPKTSIRIVGGERSRNKTIHIAGLTRGELEAKIPGLTG